MEKLLPRYAQLAQELGIGNTPLVELPAPGQNRIFAKCEYRNPGGSHYDRVYIHLLSDLERAGKIRPDVTTLVEVTSGSAGISCSMLARDLGFDGCLIFAPEVIPEARLRLIRANGAEVCITSNEGYVGTAAEAMGTFVKEHVREKVDGLRRYFPPDHSRSEVSIEALASIVEEALAQAGTTFTTFIGASGNGTTMNGIGRPLRKANPQSTILAFDPEEAPAARWLKYGRPEGVSPKEHTLFGAGGYGIEFPGLKRAVEEGIITDTLTVSSWEYLQTAAELNQLGYAVGKTSAAAYHLAKKYCAEREGEDVLIVFYDESKRY